jgi:hypothetical protein
MVHTPRIILGGMYKSGGVCWALHCFPEHPEEVLGAAAFIVYSALQFEIYLPKNRSLG